MKVIVCDFKDTGALGVVLGDEAFVDANYLEAFMKQHPDAKMEDTNNENTCLSASVS